MLLELRAVGKVYRQGGAWAGPRGGRHIRALEGVSLDIAPGRCLAVAGPSGSGKSTLGRLVLGLEKPSSGSVLYKGVPYGSLNRAKRQEARRACQVVFQNSLGAVNPRFPVLEIIGEPLRYFDGLSGAKLADRAAELLQRVGLEAEGERGLLHRLPHQLSGGELQRVCLARALAPQPELIVLDEAVSSLDLLSQSLVLGLLDEIKRRSGTAFLFITHDLRVVGKMADALALIREGRLAGYAADLADPAELARLNDKPAFRELAEAVLPALP